MFTHANGLLLRKQLAIKSLVGWMLINISFIFTNFLKAKHSIFWSALLKFMLYNFKNLSYIYWLIVARIFFIHKLQLFCLKTRVPRYFILLYLFDLLFTGRAELECVIWVWSNSVNFGPNSIFILINLLYMEKLLT